MYLYISIYILTDLYIYNTVFIIFGIFFSFDSWIYKLLLWGPWQAIKKREPVLQHLVTVCQFHASKALAGNIFYLLLVAARRAII